MAATHARPAPAARSARRRPCWRRSAPRPPASCVRVPCACASLLRGAVRASVLALTPAHAGQLDDTGGNHIQRADWVKYDQTYSRKCRQCPEGTFAGATVPLNTTWLKQYVNASTDISGVS